MKLASSDKPFSNIVTYHVQRFHPEDDCWTTMREWDGFEYAKAVEMLQNARLGYRNTLFRIVRVIIEITEVKV